MLKVDTYSAKGTKLTPTALPKEFEVKDNFHLLAQAVRVYEAGAHPGLASTKTRAEVNRTKHKLYAQKGTGGARHGARSAPIFVGGGVAHGPRPVKRLLSLPVKMKKRALEAAFALKAKNHEIIVVKALDDLKKAKDGAAFIKKLGRGTKYTFVAKEADGGRALMNIQGVKVELFRNLNAYKVLFGGTLVIDEGVFDKAKPVAPKKAAAKETEK